MVYLPWRPWKLFISHFQNKPAKPVPECLHSGLALRMIEVAVTAAEDMQSSTQIVTTNRPTSSFLKARGRWPYFLQAGRPSRHLANSVKALRSTHCTHPKLISGSSVAYLFQHNKLMKLTRIWKWYIVALH